MKNKKKEIFPLLKICIKIDMLNGRKTNFLHAVRGVSCAGVCVCEGEAVVFCFFPTLSVGVNRG